MVKTFLFFFFFLPCALLEFFYYEKFGFALLGGLYTILSIQADMSARRLALHGVRYNPAAGPRKRWNEFNGDEPELELNVARLGEKNHARTEAKGEAVFASAPRQERRKPAAEVRPILEKARKAPPPPKKQAEQAMPHHEQATPGNAEAPQRKLPRMPEPHEILGVPREAATRTIVNAFRRWIKLVHPDNAKGGKAPELANFQARMITEAKRKLLEDRRSKKAA